MTTSRLRRHGGAKRGWVLGSVRLLSAGVLLCAVASCSEATVPDPRFPEAVAQGINPGLLDRAYGQARATPGVLSLLVQRHGVLVAEEYFHGSAADSLNQVWSVTKSVMSILTGIALDQGHITSLEQTLDDLLPAIVDSLPEDKGRITLRQLLTMTSGLQWHEFDGGGEYNLWVTSEDMIQYVIDRPWAYAPGEAFLYNTGGSHLVSVILTEATGMSTMDFANRNVFEPLGIEEADWWTDERGYYTGGMGLWLRPRDMMRVGELFLREGAIDGARVVPTEWVRESTAPYIPTGYPAPQGSEYAYSWWVGHGQGHDYYFASGFAGQFIFVVPELDLVVVATSSWRGLDWDEAGAQWTGVLGVIVNALLPAVWR